MQYIFADRPHFSYAMNFQYILDILKLNIKNDLIRSTQMCCRGVCFVSLSLVNYLSILSERISFSSLFQKKNKVGDSHNFLYCTTKEMSFIMNLTILIHWKLIMYFVLLPSNSATLCWHYKLVHIQCISGNTEPSFQMV